ncbi:MAG: UDP-N-acetylmuramoyl-L-alanyl-D-glutamate--2,6-diaminopimelate ligase [Capnocytophaga sp.]|nr:UDP-N-acetylmuramoyl-L-alanyl-D-glutamate--2,6-diaminopimelate ligase [Capnocytophaga sp.]
MNTNELLHNVTVTQLLNERSLAVSDLCFDSRQVAEGSVFVAISGTANDGHLFIEKAISQGAVAIVCERLPEEIKNTVLYIEVDNSNVALAQMAANFYRHPSKEIKLVGITGTNGKTTVATLSHQLFQKAGYKAGLISTVVIRIGEEAFEATHTTPDPLTINRFLRKMADSGVAYCFMEVSSHGINQHRTEGLVFAGGVFTNLTHDHLDYHKTFAEYRNVKKRFFDGLPKEAFALANADDKNGTFMLQNTKAAKRTYSLKSVSDYMGQVLESGFDGMLLKINGVELWTRLIGQFNAYNIVTVCAVGELLGLEQNEVLTHVSEVFPVRGRFQYFVSESGIVVIVDYAHTPDALQNVLETIGQIRSRNEKLTTVIGCGGNRDKEKRPVMARIATSLSDSVILTSDNPREENPDTILSDMEQGIPAEFYNRFVTISDRKNAIKTACQNAQKGDIILIAGKGHETYQEIKGVRHHFDDVQIVRENMKLFKK